MMPAEEPRGLDRFIAASVQSADGDDIGRIVRFLPHRITGLPTWMVIMKLPAPKQLILPVAGCDFDDDGVVTPYTQERVEHQPEIDIEDDALSPESEAVLDSYFELGAEKERLDSA